MMLVSMSHMFSMTSITCDSIYVKSTPKSRRINIVDSNTIQYEVLNHRRRDIKHKFAQSEVELECSDKFER